MKLRACSSLAVNVGFFEQIGDIETGNPWNFAFWTPTLLVVVDVHPT